MSREQGPDAMGMPPTANAFGRRQCGCETVTVEKEAAT